MDSTERMLIIGAGPTGLAVARALKSHGIAYDQVEASDDVGGNWHHGVYETAHIISSARTTEYQDFPMPASYPDFPSAKQMHAYFRMYADHFSLHEDLSFETRVERVRPRPDEHWDVDLTLPDGREERRVYKGVMVCNGHHWDRRWPEYPGGFSGEWIHSKDYLRPSQLAGKRVLVIGAGNSACDVASEAARVGASCDISMRRGMWFLPKTFFGRPSVELVKGWLPVGVQKLMIKSLVKISVGDYRDYGLQRPDHEPFDTHPTISTEILHYLKHGRITPRVAIERLEGDAVRFADGSVGHYDLVVCATGFHLSFPMLPPGLVEVEGPVAKLYGSALTDTHRHLYLCGTSQVRYGIGPLLTPYADVLARMVEAQDRMTRPLGAVLRALGDRPPSTHLVDPHQALRRLALGKRMIPLMPRVERLLERGSPRRLLPAAAPG